MQTCCRDEISLLHRQFILTAYWNLRIENHTCKTKSTSRFVFLYHLGFEVELPPYADGGAQENAHRAGTENIASIIGMAAALKANCDALEQNLQYISKLEHLLISMLDESEIAYRRNGGENRLPGLVSLSFPGKDGETILHRMDLMGISISTGSACDNVNTEISHVLQAIMLDEEHSKGTVRISLGKNNTEAEAGRIAEALIRIIV